MPEECEVGMSGMDFYGRMHHVRKKALVDASNFIRGQNFKTAS